MNINRNIQLFLQKLDIKGKRVAVGYSAGADSTALLHIMKQKSEHFGFTLEAVFFSHSGSPINEGEDKNLELARKFCKDLNVTLIEVDLNLVKSAKKSWEQLGRNGRLDFYKQANYDMVFLGHHLDDQNETTMMQIMRGGGRGTGGMKEIEGNFYRPMLNVSKKDIYKYLVDRNIPWIEDPTNSNTEFTRNFWRKIGLPAIEKHYSNYSQLLENFRNKINHLNQIAFDMALMDGLNDFISEKSINTRSIPDYRIQNLLSFSFSITGNSIENNKIENLLKIGKAKKENTFIETENFTIGYNGEEIWLINHEFNKKNKPKMK